jgi:DNA-binding transcriptional MocR family regulator
MTVSETLDITLDRNAAIPQYQQIRDQIQVQIETGRLRPGTRLPGSRSLATALGVARVSVITAYQLLEQAQWLESHDRRGLFVRGAIGEVRSLSRSLRDGDYGEAIGINPANTASGYFPKLIQFSLGSLPSDFIPVEAMRTALNRALDRDIMGVLGHEPTEGYPPLRRAIAEWVAQLGVTVGHEDVLITGGCQQAIDLVVQSLVPQGGVILTTDPTYIGLIDIARARGMTLLTVPYNHGELNFEMLVNIAAERNPRLFYMMPTFHNPTGSVLPTAARRQLLAWSDSYHIPILEDGVYDGLWYSPNTLQPLKAMDAQGNVLYASGFSKTVAPGSRIGYLLVSERLRSRIIRVKQAADVGTPGLHQRAMADLISSGTLTAHLEKVRKACQARRDALIHEWQKTFSDWQFSIPQGGLYLWATMPTDGPTAAQLAEQAQKTGVDFALGADFSPVDSHISAAENRAIRLNFATHPPPIIAEGIRRLQQAYLRCASAYGE